MSELFPEWSDDEELFGREMTCCTRYMVDCPKLKRDGYNCYGLNQNGMVVPWGLKEPNEFQSFLVRKLFGPCKCLSNTIYIDCQCGIIIISYGNDINLNNIVYLSNFKNVIQERAQKGSEFDIKALKYGREINYNF